MDAPRRRWEWVVLGYEDEVLSVWPTKAAAEAEYDRRIFSAYGVRRQQVPAIAGRRTS